MSTEESIGDFLDRLETTAGKQWKPEDRERLYRITPMWVSMFDCSSTDKFTQLKVIDETRQKYVRKVIDRLDE